MPKRRYSDEERAACLAALAANGGNLQKTARECGVPDATLRHWRDGDRHPEALKMGELKKGDLADIYERIAYDSLDLAGAKLKDLNAKDLVMTAAIATDKMRLLRGESTANVNVRPDLSNLSDEDLESLDRLAAIARGHRVGALPAPP